MQGHLRGSRTPALPVQWFKLLNRQRCRCRQLVQPVASTAAPAAPDRRQTLDKRKRQAPAGRGRKPAQQSFPRKPRPAPTERLSKVMAAAGVASRRGAEELIALGSVSVNGNLVCTNVPVNARTDKVTIKGKPLPSAVRQQLIFAVHKPKGYICSSAPGHTEQARQVMALLDGWKERSWPRMAGNQGVSPPRMFSVGRLDVQSTGLIFVTNDGDWANRVAHPSSGVVKEYVVTTSQQPTARQLQAMEDGRVVDGELLKPSTVGLETSDPNSRCRFRIVMAQGRNREVRRLAEAVGLEVRYLKRVRIGGYRMPSDLGIGGVRLLRPKEVQQVTDAGLQWNFQG